MKYICVYGASGNEIPAQCLSEARKLGELLAQNGMGVVNGAGKNGVMRATSDGALAFGGEAVGVIPQFMVDNQWHYERMTRLVVTADMHERKRTMASLSAAAVAMPGGIGTMEEFLEIITWRQLGLYKHPVVLMNINGYYDHLIAMLGTAQQQGFMRPHDGELWHVSTTAQEAIDYLLDSDSDPDPD